MTMMAGERYLFLGPHLPSKGQTKFMTYYRLLKSQDFLGPRHCSKGQITFIFSSILLSEAASNFFALNKGDD